MYSLLALCVVFAFVDANVIEPCELPLDMGVTPCKGGKKEIRWHFDKKSQLPLAFEYTGCGGNMNNFKSSSECRVACLGIDNNGCPAGSAPLEKPHCKEDKDCGPKGSCQWGSTDFQICCDKSIVDKFESDWHPKCPKGKKAYETLQGGFEQILIGKNCKSKFCPTGATCVEGNYFATCCK